MILNLLRTVFDEEDLETMKQFVRTELESDTEFHYPSGKRTSRMNMGQITKIAFELKKSTQDLLNEMDSSDDEAADNAMDKESIEKRSKMQSWFFFCEEKVAVLERTWNRKLDKPEEEPAPASASQIGGGLGGGAFEDDDDHEKRIQDMLDNFKPNKIIRGRQGGRGAGEGNNSAASEAAKGAMEPFKKEETTGEYGDNQFWKTPSLDFDLDELMADMA